MLESEAARPKAIDKDTAKRLLQTIYAAPHGVYAMSQDIPGLVETSTNLASVKMKSGHIIRIETSQRSSTASSKQDIANMVRTVFEMGGAAVSFGDGYPGWKPNPHSEILEVAVESYKRLFGVDAKVKAIHAGLECGLFLDKYPALDMISFGPTLQVCTLPTTDADSYCTEVLGPSAGYTEAHTSEIDILRFPKRGTEIVLYERYP